MTRLIVILGFTSCCIIFILHYKFMSAWNKDHGRHYSFIKRTLLMNSAMFTLGLSEECKLARNRLLFSILLFFILVIFGFAAIKLTK